VLGRSHRPLCQNRSGGSILPVMVALELIAAEMAVVSIPDLMTGFWASIATMLGSPAGSTTRLSVSNECSHRQPWRHTLRSLT
jgi:hypothetical protein